MQIDAVLEVEAGDPQIAIDFLVANVNLSKSRLKDLMNKGGVWRVTKTGARDRLRRAMTDIFVGEQIEIFYDEDLLAIKPIKPELLEDLGQYSVWHKPQGVPLTGSDWGDFHSFTRALALAFKPERDLYWFQAFDYDASGLMVLAHTRKAAADLTVQFDPEGLNSTKIHYRCEVVGDYQGPETIDQILDDLNASTRVQKVRYDARPNRSVLDVWPATARPNQVRRHLADAGYPIVGDEPNGQESGIGEMLRMKIVELEFECPVKGQIQRFSLVD